MQRLAQLKSTFELEERLRREEGALNEMKAKHAAVTNECEAGMQDCRKQWEAEKQEILNRKNKEYSEAKDKLQELTKKLENIQIFKVAARTNIGKRGIVPSEDCTAEGENRKSKGGPPR